MLIFGTGKEAVHTHAMSQEVCGCVATIAHPCIIDLSWIAGSWGSSSNCAGIVEGLIGVVARLSGGDLGVMRLGIAGDPAGDIRIVTSLLFFDLVARYVVEVTTAVIVNVSPSSILFGVASVSEDCQLHLRIGFLRAPRPATRLVMPLT